MPAGGPGGYLQPYTQGSHSILFYAAVLITVSSLSFGSPVQYAGSSCPKSSIN